MARIRDEQTELVWTSARLGYDSDSLAIICRTVKINPQKPPYSLISVDALPKHEEVELLVATHLKTWMKLRVFIEGNQISYLAYRTYGHTEMMDGLAAIRQQNIDSGLINPPIRESLNMFSGKFDRIYKLPELTGWDRAKAQAWLELQSTPGTAVNLLHERALDNNYVGRSWVPVWMRLNKDVFRQGPVSIAHMTKMADEVDDKYSSSVQDTTDIVVGEKSAWREKVRMKSWWQWLFGRKD